MIITVINMKFEIFFITSEFKELIDEKILKEMLDMENDDYYKKQISYFFLKPKKNDVYEVLKNQLGTRDDIIIDDEIVIFRNQVTGDSAKLTYGEDNSFYINCNDRYNPLLNALITKYSILLYEI